MAGIELLEVAVELFLNIGYGVKHNHRPYGTQIGYFHEHLIFCTQMMEEYLLTE